MSKQPTLGNIAERISRHLRRFEADTKEGGANWWHDGVVGGTRPYYNAGAFASGNRVFVTYVSYQGSASLTKARALLYLAWLDVGNVGTHRGVLP